MQKKSIRLLDSKIESVRRPVSFQSLDEIGRVLSLTTCSVFEIEENFLHNSIY